MQSPLQGAHKCCSFELPCPLRVDHLRALEWLLTLKTFLPSSYLHYKLNKTFCNESNNFGQPCIWAISYVVLWMAKTCLTWHHLCSWGWHWLSLSENRLEQVSHGANGESQLVPFTQASSLSPTLLKLGLILVSVLIKCWVLWSGLWRHLKLVDIELLIGGFFT